MGYSAEDLDGMSEEDWEDMVSKKMDHSYFDGGDIEFADPSGDSALRAASKSDPRIHPCPDCDSPNRLTREDVRLHYCCNACAEKNEGGGY